MDLPMKKENCLDENEFINKTFFVTEQNEINDSLMSQTDSQAINLTEKVFLMGIY